MTVFITFTMGSKESYFFNTPTHWAWKNLPPDVEALFTKQPPIRDVLELALGENGTYFISYRDHDGQLYCRHYNLPNPLTTYLYHSHPQVIRDLSTLSITLGPYESYYAHDKTSADWSNLPPSLEKALLNRLETQDAWKTIWKDSGREAPSYVSLGADGSYFMRTVGGGGSWDLKSKAEGMMGSNKFLEESPNFLGVTGLYLFNGYPECYVLLLTTGKAFSNLPEHTWADYNKMADKLPSTIQTMAPIPPMPIQQLQQQGAQVSTAYQQPVQPLQPLQTGFQQPVPQQPASAEQTPTPRYSTLYPPPYTQQRQLNQNRSPVSGTGAGLPLPSQQFAGQMNGVVYR